MATVSFKGKVETIYNMDDSVAYLRVKVPKLERKHCDMQAFRFHPKFGGIANSDLFPNALERIRRDRLGDYVRLDKIPENVTVDTSGFLAKVSFDA
jgi:hypothetical protein